MAVSRGVRRITALAVVTLSLAVGGCGRRGELEPAPNPDNPFALGNPKPAASGPDDQNRSGLQRRPKNPPIKPPNEPFILDPLL